ncbi:MAG: thermonuclease family protein [Methylococcaceae bacterium]|nr:thermonuclease family protein [Methylococcaceae bacterium]
MKTFERNRIRPALAAQILLGLFALLLANEGNGEVYRWRDERGRTHFGDRPLPGAERIREPAPPATALFSWRKVIRVYDGDTITLEGGEKVRLLGINTPEIGGRKPLEAGGLEARDWLREKIAGRRVRLEPGTESRDQYGRLLAHIFTEDGIHINLELVEQGLATTDIFPPNLKYVDELVAAERRAEQKKRGLWAMPEYQPKPLESSTNLEGWQRLTAKPLATAAGKNWRGLRFAGEFELHIPMENWGLFPPLESYLGRTLEIRGWISRRGGGNSILIRHPSALLIR